MRLTRLAVAIALVVPLAACSSEPKPEDNWTGRTGFVHLAVMEDHPDLSGHQVYACGAPLMIDAAKRDFAQRCGLPPSEFYADSFTYAAETEARP